MDVRVISREIIKPSTPTPLPLQYFRISLLDQFAPPSYIPLILFYDTDDHAFDHLKVVLKKSLSETLTRFYPLAGRFIKQDNQVHCNDQGAEFTESRVNLPMAPFVSNPDMQLLERFLPRKCPMSESDIEPQLAIQANLFSCGGLAIGISISHKIADAATLSAFLHCWSSIALAPVDDNKNNNNIITPPPPSFDLAQILPVKPDSALTTKIRAQAQAKQGEASLSSRRFVFNSKAISDLKAKAASSSNNNDIVTRVEAVTALLWKCLISVSDRPIKYVLIFPVNLRSRMDPPLPDSSFGNICKTAMVAPPPASIESDPDLSQLVSQLRDATGKIDADYAKKQDVYHGMLVLHEPFTRVFSDDGTMQKEFFTVSSWCRLPFYDADLGWGKPIWVSSCNFSPQNGLIILMDTRDGDGVEALVSLDEQHLIRFEKHPHLLPFLSSN